MRFSVTAIQFFERDVKLRMPFRFGVVTLKEAPQAFVRQQGMMSMQSISCTGYASRATPDWGAMRAMP